MRYRAVANGSGLRRRVLFFPPKAKVRSSNLLGRANQINDLPKSVRMPAKDKLTTNSPTERAFWRVIGGDFVNWFPRSRSSPGDSASRAARGTGSGVRLRVRSQRCPSARRSGGGESPQLMN